MLYGELSTTKGTSEEYLKFTTRIINSDILRRIQGQHIIILQFSGSGL